MATDFDGRLERLRLNPDDDVMFRGLARELRAHRALEPLAEAFRVRASSASGWDAARLWLSLADDLVADEAAQRHDALSQAVRAAAAVKGGLADLQAVFERAGADDALRITLRHRLDVGDEAAASARALIEMGERSGDEDLQREAWIALGDADTSASREAAEALLRLDAMADVSSAAATATERFARAAGDDRLLLHVLQTRLSGMKSARPGLVVPVILEMAERTWAATADADPTVDLLERAHQRSPGDAARVLETLRSLKATIGRPTARMIALERDLCEQLGEWDAAANLALEEAGMIGDDTRAGELRLRAADTLALRAGRVQDALSHYADAARLAPSLRPVVDKRLQELGGAEGSDPATLRAARLEMMQRAGDHAGVHELLLEDLDTLSDAARVARLLELADLESGSLGRPDLALRTLGHVARDGHATDAQKASAIEALFDLLAVHAVAEDAGAELATLLAEQERWSELLRLRRRQLERAGDDATRARAWARIAELQTDHMDAPREAAEAWERASELSDANARYYDRAREAWLALGEIDDALRLVNREYRETGDTERQIDLDIERARIFADVREDLQLAIDALFSAIEDRHDAPRLQSALGRLVERVGAVDTARTLAVSFAERGDDRRGRDLLWMVAEHVGLRSDDGASLALQALDMAGLDVMRLGLLRAAVDERSVDTERIPVLRTVAAEGPSEDARRIARRELALLVARHDGRDEAIALANELLAERPDDEALQLARIDWLADGEGITAHAAAIDEALSVLALDQEVALRLLKALAELHAEALGRTDLAFETWRRVLRLDASDTDALAAVRAHADASDDGEALYEVLRTSLDDLADEAQVAQREHDLAMLCEEKLDDPGRAAMHWAAVANAESMSAEMRLHAAGRVVDTAFDRGEFELVVGGFAVEMPLHAAANDDAEAATERVERLFEDLLDAREHGAALDITDIALEHIEAPSAWLLDRRSRTAAHLRLDDVELESLERLAAEHADALPLDRRARLAELLLVSGDEARVASGWTLVREVLAADPHQPEVRGLLGRPPFDAERTAIAEHLRALGSEDDGDVEALYAAAELLVAVNQSTEPAEPIWRQIVERDAGQRRALEALEASLRDRDAIDELRALLDERLAAIGEDGNRVELLRTLSELSADDEERERRLLAILEADLGDIDARRGLVVLYRKQDRHEELADVLEELGNLETDEERRKQALSGLSKIASFQLGDKARAAKALEALVELDPRDAALVERLEKLHRATDNDEGLVHALEKRVILTEDIDEKIALWKRIARLREEKLDDRARALRTLERIIELEPANLPVLEEMARIHADLEDWAQHVKTLEVLAERSGSRAIEAEIFARAAGPMHEHLDRSRDALELLARAAEVVPLDDEKLDLARAAATAATAWVALANILRRAAERRRDEDERATLEAEVGLLLDEKADDPDASLQWLLDAFNRAPGLGPVLEALEAVAERRERRKNLVEVYKALAADESDDADVRWTGLLGSASIAETEVERPDMAWQIMARAAEDDDLREKAEAEMERLAREHDLWDQHREYLESLADSDSASVSALLRKAKLEETELDDWEAAFETLVGAFQDAPDDEQVRTELYRLAGEHDAWDFIVKLYEVVQDGEPDTVRVKRLLEMARILSDELDNPGAAFTQHLRAWQLKPRDEDVRNGLVERADAAGRRADLLAAWEWEARNTEEPAARTDAWARAANLAAEFERWDPAMVAWSELVVMRGQTIEWLDRADAVLTEAGERMRLVAGLTEVAGSVRDRGDRQALRIRLAEIAREGGELEVAAAILDAALKEATDIGEVRTRLIDVLRECDADGTRLAKQLEASVKSAEDADAADEIARELQDVYLVRIGDIDKATRIARRRLKARPDDQALVDEMVAHLRAVERWDELAEFHLDRASLTDDDEVRRTNTLAAAAVVEEFAEDPRRAARIVDKWLDDHPTDVDALGIRARAQARLQQWTDHIQTLLAIAEHTEGRTAAKAIAQAADVLENQLFYSDRALAAWEAAAGASDDWAEPWTHVARLRAEADDLAGAAEAWREAIPRLEDGGASGHRRSHAMHQLAVVLNGMGEDADSDEVHRLLEAAVDADPANSDARADWEAWLEASGGLDRLLSLLDEELERAQTDEDRARVLTRRAAVYGFDAGRDADARKALQRALELDPSNPAPIAVTGDLHLRGQRWDDAAVAYEVLFGEDETFDTSRLLDPRRILPGEQTDADPIVLYTVRRARALERAGRTDEAYDLYATAALDDESNAVALHALAKLSVQRGNLAGAAIHVSGFLERVQNAPPELAAEMQQLAGRIAESEGDMNRAMELYDAATSHGSATSREALERAATAFVRQGDYDAAFTRVERLVELAETPSDRASTLLRLAETAAASESYGERVANALRQAILLAASDVTIERALELADQHLTSEARWTMLAELDVEIGSDTSRARVLSARARALVDLQGSASPEAFDLARAAVEADAHLPNALDHLVEVGLASVGAEAVASSLREVADGLGEDDLGARIEVLRALASVQLDHLSDVEGARASLEAIREVTVDDVRTLERLLDVYDRSDAAADDESALAVAAELVSLGALSESLLRTLTRVHYASDNLDGVLQALQVLRLANAASDDEMALLDQLPKPLPDFEDGALAESLWDAWLAPERLDPAVIELVARASDAVLAAGDVTFDVDGDPVPESSAVMTAFVALRNAFGVPDAMLRVTAKASAPARWIPAGPGVVEIAPALLALDDPYALRFELARALTFARPAFRLMGSLSAFEFLGFFEAAMAPACSDAPVLDESLAAQVDRWRPRVGDLALPDGLEPTDRDLLPSVAAWREHVEASAVRAGIVASFDSAAAFEALVEQAWESPPGSVDDLRALADRVPTIRALVTFVLSDRYLGVRRDLGLVLGS